MERPQKSICIGIALIILSLSGVETQGAPTSGLSQKLLKEMHQQKKGDFKGLVQKWKELHGTRAVSSLLEIAKDTRNSEKVRTIAILGSAELSQTQDQTIYSDFKNLLKDSKWLIRFSALKGLERVSSKSAIECVAERLKDPALVVRTQAAESIAKMAKKNPNFVSPQILKQLSASLADPQNYHQGKALWVPQRALAALIAFQAKSELKSIGRLLDLADSRLVKQALIGLEEITGEPSGKRSPSEWKAWLSQNTGSESD